MEEENERLREQTKQEQTHQTEIFSYLNKELVDKSQQLHLLERQVHMLENSVTNQSADFDQKLIGEKRAARDLTTKLAKEVGDLERNHPEDSEPCHCHLTEQNAERRWVDTRKNWSISTTSLQGKPTSRRSLKTLEPTFSGSLQAHTPVQKK